MLQLFKKKKKEKKEKKKNEAEKANVTKGQALSNGEDEVNQLTVGEQDLPKKRAPPVPVNVVPVTANVNLKCENLNAFHAFQR